MYVRPRRTANPRQDLFVFAGLVFAFCLLCLFDYIGATNNPGPGSDGNVTCNGQTMSPGDTCEHTTNGMDEGSYTYDQQAQSQDDLRAQGQSTAQEFGTISGIAGGLGLIFLIWGLCLKKV